MSTLGASIGMAVMVTAAWSASALAQDSLLPFGIGERLEYRVSVGKLGSVGSGTMSIDGPVDVRGTMTVVLRSEIQARVGLIKSTERATSWIDPARMTALRYQKRTRGMFSRARM